MSKELFETLVAINKLKDNNGNCSFRRLADYLRENYEQEEIKAHCEELEREGCIYFSATNVGGPRRWRVEPITLLSRGISLLREIQRNQSTDDDEKPRIGF